MRVEKNNIALITTVVNFGLYAKTSRRFPTGIQHFVIDGRNGMHGIDSIVYMFKKLKKYNIKWLIMADEDVIFNDEDYIFDLINLLNKNNYLCCGVRDGGVIKHRNYNPFAINTFFSIINFEKLKSIFNISKIKKHQYIRKGEFNDDLGNTIFNYNKESLYEQYYCFYFWLRRNGGRILFLNSKMGDDAISNKLFSPEGLELLTHTWYARSYGINQTQTKRIDGLLNGFNFQNYSPPTPIYFKDRRFALRKLLRKSKKRIEMKLKK